MPIAPIPPETARVAHAVFPKGNRYRRRADELDPRFPDDALLALFPTHGQPALPPWRRALVTRFQCAEGLADRQAAEAVRRRLDWPDGRRLELTAPGVDASGRSDCRGRLSAGAAAHLRCDTWLTWCRSRQLVKARGRQRPDSTHILAAVRALNRLEVVGDTMRHALNTLAVVAPAWLRAVSPTEWRDRDVRRAEDDRLPTTHAARAALALTIGNDGWRLLAAVDHVEAPPWLRESPAVTILRRVWIHNDLWAGTQLQGRETDPIPPAAPCISSPYDADAHYARTHPTQWVGDQVQLTEPCEDARPHLITNGDTTIGPEADGAATPRSHAALQQRALLPRTPIVDPGFLDAALLVDSQADSRVDLLGPTRLDYHGQARAGAGCDAQHVPIDGEHQHATGPAGKPSLSWTPAVDNRENPVIRGKKRLAAIRCHRCTINFRF